MMCVTDDFTSARVDNLPEAKIHYLSVTFGEFAEGMTEEMREAASRGT